MAATDKLRKDIDTKIKKWNEKSSFTLKGVKNLSRSDLDMILLYADTYDRTGSFSGLMKPLGEIARVLGAYGIS